VQSCRDTDVQGAGAEVLTSRCLEGHAEVQQRGGDWCAGAAVACAEQGVQSCILVGGADAEVQRGVDMGVLRGDVLLRMFFLSRVDCVRAKVHRL